MIKFRFSIDSIHEHINKYERHILFQIHLLQFKFF